LRYWVIVLGYWLLGFLTYWVALANGESLPSPPRPRLELDTQWSTSAINSLGKSLVWLVLLREDRSHGMVTIQRCRCAGRGDGLLWAVKRR
jgi:hypothetical protein